MMKLILIFSLITAVVAGCHSPAAPAEATRMYTDSITPRNISITSSGSYNDLFLDSNAVTRFITAQHLDDTVANRLISFYNARNYEFAWLDSTGLTEEAAAFRSLYSYLKDSVHNRELDTRMNALMEEDSLHVSARDPAMVNTELMLTIRLIQYFREKGGSVAVMEQMVPVSKQTTEQLTETMMGVDDKLYPAAAAMKPWLKKYRDIVKNGGWEPVAISRKAYSKGQSSPEIIPLKKRLAITGELKQMDSTTVFTEELEAAVNTFRNAHGYTQNGVINDTVIRAMNIPAAQRQQQLLINMQRMKWMPAEPEGKLILVNIPAFVLHVTNKGKKVFDMDIVVGKEGHSTTMFSGKLNMVVFSPYWNIPRSIVRKEILPAMRRNSSYLARRNMEITKVVNGVPRIRQRPGPRNALGRVKFLFPNSFNIYFHDTPEKSLFNRDIRAYSHGCIRLREPLKMAQFLLEDSPRWTNEKIDSAMNSRKQQYIPIRPPVPVIITYFTSWADDADGLHQVTDVYGHDERMRTKMFL
ncbi:L,D-transpeptidase family protein [Chitinophaga solisilvae]|uniref:L,D-transpeptidase family protein n=1 Tax=Chitinophaga solisilvae TaxID=1233460 RepID=UPI00136FA12B|nr:L,D-transpeptidase family protein [Chitinophaga solisilvae]